MPRQQATDKPRRQQILEALAAQLEQAPGQRITTAGLARAVGVTEAALYRHFPSKARIFEGLIEFAEDSVFGLLNRVMEDESNAAARIDGMLRVILGFADRNAGIARLLHGDVLTGEHERLRARVTQFYDRVETQLRQVFRESKLGGDIGLAGDAEKLAALSSAVVLGRIDRFVSSEFGRRPLDGWDQQWLLLAPALFRAGVE